MIIFTNLHIHVSIAFESAKYTFLICVMNYILRKSISGIYLLGYSIDNRLCNYEL